MERKKAQNINWGKKNSFLCARRIYRKNGKKNNTSNGTQYRTHSFHWFYVMDWVGLFPFFPFSRCCWVYQNVAFKHTPLFEWKMNRTLNKFIVEVEHLRRNRHRNDNKLSVDERIWCWFDRCSFSVLPFIYFSTWFCVRQFLPNEFKRAILLLL